MSHGFFSTIFVIPLYNALIFLVDVLPGHSAGLAVVILTIIIRLILFPLSRKAIKTQLGMRRLEPQINELKQKYSDKQEQARKLLELYRANDVNPFASLLLILIQLPILIGLYQVFRIGLGAVDTSFLYSFVTIPEYIGTVFAGISLTGKSVILAILAVITQFIQIQISLPNLPKKAATDGKPSFADDLQRSMNTQMKYVFPLILFPIAYVSAVLALYFVVGNIFMILQEIFVKRRMEKKFELKG